MKKLFGGEASTVRCVRSGTETIEYTLTYKNVTNMNLRIRDDGSVHVSVNRFTLPSRADGFVREKAGFILAARRKFREREQASPRLQRCEDGETFKLFGADMRLRIVPSAKEKVCEDGGVLYLCVKNPDNLLRRQKLARRWLLEKARQVFERAVAETHEAFKKFGVSVPTLTIRDMSGRWGSCNPSKNRMTLNLRLAALPLQCLDYVAAHEFCHYLQPNHSPAFYALLQTVIPDWQERKRLLENAGAPAIRE